MSSCNMRAECETGCQILKTCVLQRKAVGKKNNGNKCRENAQKYTCGDTTGRPINMCVNLKERKGKEDLCAPSISDRSSRLSLGVTQ